MTVTSVQGDQSTIAAGIPTPSSSIFRTEPATNPPPAESPYIAISSGEYPFSFINARITDTTSVVV